MENQSIDIAPIKETAQFRPAAENNSTEDFKEKTYYMELPC